jgi:hypothetical protein
VWPDLVVIDSPLLDFLRRVGQAQEPVLVQAFLPDTPVEGLDKRIVGRLSRSAEVEGHLVEVRPSVKRLRDKLRAIVYSDRLRDGPAMLLDRVEYSHHVVARQPLTGPDRQTLTGKVID